MNSLILQKDERSLPVGSSVQTAPSEPSCWNRRGVYGDSTCAELHQLGHCRHCPVYSSAAFELLNRPLAAAYREEWSDRVAGSAKASELPRASVILFRIGREWLALPTCCFQEVTTCRPLHSVPHQPPFLLGLANVRGELVLCVSLAHFLSLSEVPDRSELQKSHEMLLVVNWNGSHLCFPADEVQGPRRFSQEDLKPAGARLAQSESGLTGCVLPCEQRAVGLLDANSLCAALAQSLK